MTINREDTEFGLMGDALKWLARELSFGARAGLYRPTDEVMRIIARMCNRKESLTDLDVLRSSRSTEWRVPAPSDVEDG